MRHHRDPIEGMVDDAFTGIVTGIFKVIGLLVFGLFWGIIELIKWASAESKELSLALPLRFEHMHVLAGSGHGKTQTLQYLIASHDLAEVAAGKRSVIVIDSQGEMIDKLLHLAELSPSRKELSERLVYIDPTDLDYPPALNLFDFGMTRIGRYSRLEQETLLQGAIALFGYLFGPLLGADMTNRQGTNFRYLARLLMVVPGATIYTLMDFMEDPQLVRPYLSRLDPLSRRFFETRFFLSTFDATRSQILDRLWGVLSSSDVLARMFSHRRTKLDLFSAMNRGSIILVNTAKDLLKAEGCEIFGRFLIALIAQATQERAGIAKAKQTPTIVYIDECQDYVGEGGGGMQMLIDQGRKYQVGCVLANQNLTQLDRRLKVSINASTAIKLAGGVSKDDCLDVAGEMACEPDFIRAMTKKSHETRFAMSIRNITPEAVERTVPFGLLEQRPRMSQGELTTLLRQNRARHCAPFDPSVLAASVAVSSKGFNLGAPQTTM
jgi:hypothetical protein